MRKLVLSGIATLSLFAALPAHSQTGFATGLATGMMLSGSNNPLAVSGTPNLLYVMPHAAERIIDPLALRADVSSCISGEETVQEEFRDTVDKKNRNNAIIQVQLILQLEPRCLLYVFVSTNQTNLKPDSTTK